MRKLLAISILVFYLGLTVIKTIGLHYCQGNLQSIDVLHQSKACCSIPGFEQPSCCNNILITVDICKDQLSVQYLTILPPVESGQLFDFLPHHEINEIDSERPLFNVPINESPPSERYMLYHSFLFYG